MYRAPHRCVVCDSKLTVTQLTCESCGTRIEGRFEGCPFCSLSPDQTRFLLTFIKNRGSIKDVERDMGVSYPTVRAALDNLIASLGFAPAEPTDATPESRADVLEALASGKLTSDEALEKLAKLPPEGGKR